jgi:hypothetical protein
MSAMTVWDFEGWVALSTCPVASNSSAHRRPHPVVHRLERNGSVAMQGGDFKTRHRYRSTASA